MNLTFKMRFTHPGYRRMLTVVILGLALISVYYPVCTFEYLYHDDWSHFNWRGAGCSNFSMYQWFRMMGRPVGHDVLCLLFGMFDGIGQAWVARLSVVLGIIAFAFLQSLFFEALGVSWVTSVCLAFGTSILPGMLVFGFWIGAGFIVFSLLASVAAVLVTQAALPSSKSHARRASLIACACILQVISLLIYQTGAMYFWTLTAVMAVVRMREDPRSAIRPLVLYAVTGAVPMVCYFAWFKYLSGYALALEARDPQRGQMFHGLGEGISWFSSTVLPRASSLWFFESSPQFGVVALAIFMLLLIAAVSRRWLVAWRQSDRTAGLLYAAYPSLMVAFAGLTYSTMLVTDFRLALFRSLVPLSAMIFTSGVLHLQVALRAERWPSLIKWCCGGAFVFGLACFATTSLASLMVVPAAAEYSFVRSSLGEAAQHEGTFKRVHAIIPVIAGKFETDEVGALSAEFSQDNLPMVNAVQRDLGLQLTPVTHSIPGEAFEREGALVLDFTILAKSGLWKSVNIIPTGLTIWPRNRNPGRPYAFVRQLSVMISAYGAPHAIVRITTDGTTPTVQSDRAKKPFTLTKSSIVKALTFVDNVPVGSQTEMEYKRLDDDGAVATAIKRGGERAELLRAAVQPGGRLALVLSDANDGIDYDQGDWADAAFECSGGRIYLSALKPQQASQDWGTLGRDKNLYNNPIKIAGQVYQHGLAVNANAELVYEVPQDCRSFVASVGLDDAVEHRGTVIFAACPIK